MNLVEHTVVEVLSEPYYSGRYWHVDVKLDIYGRIENRTLVFRNRKNASIVKVGYKFED